MRVTILGLILSASLLGQELSGRWIGKFSTTGNERGVPQLIILKQDGAEVTGSGGPDNSEQYPISNGVVTADRVRFELTTARSKFFYDLKRSGTSLNGALEIKSLNNTASATVSLKKGS